MGTENFYAELGVLPDFNVVSRPENYVDLPSDWHVVVTDVEGSTAAVREGRYKDVNLLGAASIMSILNAVRPLSIPYVFGGDGATLCVPESAVPKVRRSLIATRQMAAAEFKLSLRAGIVPVRAIVEAGCRVRIARYRASSNYTQAAFTGGGLQFAERCVKDPKQGSRYRIEETDSAAMGDYEGLECRWDNIPSPRGEIVTLLVQAMDESPERQAELYRDVIAEIARIYGDDDACRPVTEGGLRLTLDGAKLRGELRVQTAGESPFRRALAAIRMRFENVMARLFMRFGVTAGGINWGSYRRDAIANTDFRKFDDLLRHVLSGTASQREQLTRFLEERFARGELAYGLHQASTALMTCLIFAREGEHVHFIDGADGGYTMAANDLKRRLVEGAATRVPAV
jgi:hypothetical protein